MKARIRYATFGLGTPMKNYILRFKTGDDGSSYNALGPLFNGISTTYDEAKGLELIAQYNYKVIDTVEE